MAYIGATELSLILPAHVSIGTNTTPLTLGEVASMIAEVSAQLDGVAAGRGYAVPISSSATVAYAQMQDAAKNGVGWRVLRTFFPNMGGQGDKSSLAADYRDAYRTFLQDLKKGDLALVGADSDASSSGRALPRSFTTSGGANATGQTGASTMIPLGWEP